jgi:hypothetical protein
MLLLVSDAAMVLDGNGLAMMFRVLCVTGVILYSQYGVQNATCWVSL